MFQKTAKADQFHTRSGNESTKGSRKGFSLLGGGVNPASVLSLDEQRESLKAKVEGLLETKEKMQKQKIDTKEIVLEINALYVEIGNIRRAIKSVDSASIPHIFVQLCREHMTKAEFKRYLDMANEHQRNGVTANQLRAQMEERSKIK